MIQQLELHKIIKKNLKEKFAAIDFFKTNMNFFFNQNENPNFSSGFDVPWCSDSYLKTKLNI